MNSWRMIFAAVVAISVSAHAQWLNYPTAGIPRLPNGKQTTEELVVPPSVVPLLFHILMYDPQRRLVWAVGQYSHVQVLRLDAKLTMHKITE